MNVPAMIDVLQEINGNLEVPEIRVWCHPHRTGSSGDDYYKIFDSFRAAVDFIAAHRWEAESAPLVAFRGYELNLWDMHKEAHGEVPQEAHRG